MKRKFRIWVLATVVIGISLNIFWFVYTKIAIYHAKVLFKEVQNHDKLYVYDNYYPALNAAFYVEDLKDTAALISYYNKVAKHDTTDSISFEINFMRLTLHEPMYVYGYLNKGSKIIQLIDFDKDCWGYLKGYVYRPTTHLNPPPDSLIKLEEEYIAKDKLDKQKQLIHRIAKKISDYGWYCDN